MPYVRLRQRRVHVFLAQLSAALVLFGSPHPAFAQEPFGPIHVAANRSQYTGRQCPIEIVYTASINLLPHPRGLVFNYHWERSDGAKGPVEIVRPVNGERTVVIRDRWRLGAPGREYDASVKLFLNSGNTHVQEESPVVRVVCR
jgi:hypothetical protein